MKVTSVSLWTVAVLVVTTTAARADDELQSLVGSRQMISLVAGYPQQMSAAPATATVLTGDELSLRGARTVREALQYIPGFTIATSDGRDTIITIRGITSRMLILQDGIPVPVSLLQPYQSLDNLLLTNVERLEVVRGPGSSIYGADAVAGVLNIVTKTSYKTLKNELGATVGSFATHTEWVLAGVDEHEVSVNMALTARSTDASDALIAADSQTSLDQRFHTSISLAPARMPAHRDVIDAHINVTSGPFTFRGTYFDQYHWQTGLGLVEALDPSGISDSRLFGGTILYQLAEADAGSLQAVIDYSNVNQPAQSTLYPPGAFGGQFPSGVLAAFDMYNERTRGELTEIYSGWQHHTIRTGLGVLYNAFHVNYDKRNFIVRSGRLVPTGQFAVVGGVNDTPGLPTVYQTDSYLYAQDEWRFLSDWLLTVGVRADHYSDFGLTTNPRLALVWTATADLSYKLLYGRAFRPPSIFESYSTGLYTAKGNADVEPTMLDTIEASVEQRAAKHINTVTVFDYRQSNLIQVTADPLSPRGASYINHGEQSGYGMELTSEWSLASPVRVQGSYAFQHRQGHDTDNSINIRFAAKHTVNLGLLSEWLNDWRGSVLATSYFGRERPLSDTRSAARDYTLVNATIQRRAFFGRADIAFAIHNLLNADARIQSDAASSAPFDIPLPGRDYSLSISFRL